MNSHSAEQAAVSFSIQHIDHVAITVGDVERSTAWYRDVLGLERRHEDAWDEPVMMCTGPTCVALFRASVDDPHPPVGTDTISLRHIAFRLDGVGFEAVYSELLRREIAVELADHGIAHSIYIADPDGHRIELTTYDLDRPGGTARP